MMLIIPFSIVLNDGFLIDTKYDEMCRDMVYIDRTIIEIYGDL